jgi:hypothetical protein
MSKRMKTAIGVVVALVALAVAYLVVLKNSDSTTYYTYATYADVKQDTSVKGASVPPFVPRSAHNISGWYSVDANTQALEFAFEASDQADLVGGFQRATADTARDVERKVRGYRWDMDIPQDAAVVAFTSHNLGVEYLLVDERHGRAYYVAEPSEK